jgi:hypothetical protein
VSIEFESRLETPLIADQVRTLKQSIEQHRHCEIVRELGGELLFLLPCQDNLV